METEAGGPGAASKKRKRAPLESAAATEQSADDDQAPPPGAGEDKKGAVDRISHVPDAILGEIVSLLPTKEGARTQVLATRWRHVWRSAPLNLDCGEPNKNYLLDHVVTRILAAHQCPGRRLCIPPSHGCMEATVEAWFRSPTLDNLQELEFCVPHDRLTRDRWSLWGRGPFRPPLQSSIFRFAATLCLVSIGKCHLLGSTVRALHFPQLKHLALHWVRMAECSLHTLIARCSALECLLIYNMSGFRSLRINSLRLRSIGVRVHCNGETRLEELVIENAPCLERLLRLDLFDGARVSVIFAPKLEIFGSVNNGHPSFFRFIERFCADSRTTVARLVKSLAVHMPVQDLDKVIDLMRCFPCLEKLYIQNEPMHVFRSRPKNFWRREHRKLIGCLDIHLKTIVLETYKGILSEVNFVEFFVLNARELELMMIQVETIDDGFIARQHRLLQLEKKASKGARFHFTTDRCLRDIGDIYDVRDLDLTDPFVR